MKHNFPNGVYVICKEKLNKSQLKEIVWLIYSQNFNLPIIDKEYPYIGYHNADDFDAYANLNEWKLEGDVILVNYFEFKDFLQGKGKYNPPFKEELTLNDKYKAVVTRENVTVGCQKFNHETIQNLYNLSQKALKS